MANDSWLKPMDDRIAAVGEETAAIRKENEVLKMAIEFMEKHDAAFKKLAEIEREEREQGK